MKPNSFPEKKALIEAIRLAGGLGQRVAVVTSKGVEARSLFEEVRAMANPARASLVSRVNGAERIKFHGGGQIRFFGSLNRLRGCSADVLIASDVFSHEQMRELEPAIATSVHRQVIRLGDLVVQP